MTHKTNHAGFLPMCLVYAYEITYKDTMKTKNIHAYKIAGETKYAVCVRDERAGNWYRPLDRIESRLSGCSGEVAETLEYFGGYTTKAQAYSRARTLFGYARTK
jgi:hypothetical protein